MKENNILSMTINVVKNGFKNKTPIAIAIIAPIIVLFVLGYLISVVGTVEPVNIGIVDLDKGLGNMSASSTIIDELKSQNNVTLVTLSSENDIKTAMNEKRIDGALIFGQNFTTDLVLKKNAEANLAVDGLDQSKDVLITKAVSNASSLAIVKLQGGSTVPLSINTGNVYENDPSFTDLFIPNIMAFITLIMSLVLTMVTLLDDKRDNVFTTKLKSPIRSVISYTLGLSVFSFILAIMILIYAIYVIGVNLTGNLINIGVLLMLIAMVGTSLGVLISSLARNERQAFGLIALIVIAQVLFSGLLIPVFKFYTYLQAFSYILPLTYGLDAVKSVVVKGFNLGDVWIDILALVTILIISVTLSAIVLKVKARIGCNCSNS